MPSGRWIGTQKAIGGKRDGVHPGCLRMVVQHEIGINPTLLIGLSSGVQFAPAEMNDFSDFFHIVPFSFHLTFQFIVYS
jgi:hypothetical protein